MANLNEMELQSLRHIIGSHELISCKLNEYAQNAQDSQIKSMFQNAATSAKNNVSKLKQFL